MPNSITSNIEEVISGLSDLDKKQIPFAIRITTNDLAFEVLNRVKYEIATKLSINKNAMMSVVRVKKATSSRPYAEVFLDEHKWQYKAIAHHFTGGDRERKGLEKSMIYWGYMYKWEILTPSPGVKIRPGTYVQIHSQLKLDYIAGWNSNETKKSKLRKMADKKSRARFFAITGKSNSPLAPGIYTARKGDTRPTMILRIAEKPTYKKRFDFDKTLQATYRDRGDYLFNKAMQTAIRTAK